MEKKFTNESKLTFSEALNYTSSVIEPLESPDEISNKIKSMLPDMKCIQGTGIIKKTNSFKESKDILTNFRTCLYHISEEALKDNNALYSYGITNQEVLKTVNLNAYEIRLQVLKEAINWVKLHPTEDVMDVAGRFYRFVENKR